VPPYVERELRRYVTSEVLDLDEGEWIWVLCARVSSCIVRLVSLSISLPRSRIIFFRQRKTA
jgi:hypothetical protein